ncbi:WD40 repeat protein [Roseimicrobium gellanilyticum]|uniref:WD40 repeat protein n=1 Tax=Roseimicrobium gellanilyticum TaxID=748857 RepID=A0A366HLF1_9BACT|nr:c-type cytochrome domain-containing protein [Roseimicrobium gellanilyticum]RBP43769.1 WD40 repeat protein [Roseimicrobium gellanilyticum]
MKVRFPSQLKRPRHLAALVVHAAVLQATATLQATTPDFYQDVFPFLKANCISCHNKTTTKAGLNMETPELMKKGGDSGPSIVPGKSAESLIVLASQHKEDMEMPPKNNKSGAVDLTPAELEILKAWIDQGAKDSVQQERHVVLTSPSASVDPIYTVAMTRDGRYAACGRSNQIFLYDLAQRKFISKLSDGKAKDASAHRALVQTLDFSPDGTRLASGSFREVNIWKREASAAAVPRHPDAALNITICEATPNGEHLVAVNKSGDVLLLKAADGSVVKKAGNLGSTEVKQIEASREGTLLAIHSGNDMLQVWSLQDGTAKALPVTIAGLQKLAWSQDGKSIITAGADGIMRAWALPADSNSPLVKGKDLKGAAGTITSIIAGPATDQLFVASNDGKVRLWSITEAKVLRELPIPAVQSLDLSSDGKQLACGTSDGAVRIWDLATNKQAAELRGSLPTSRRITELDLAIARQALEQEYQRSQVTKLEAQNKALDELLKKANETIDSVKKSLPEKQKALPPAQEAAAAAKKALDEASAKLTSGTTDGKADAALEKERVAAQEKYDTAVKAETSAQAALSAAEQNIKDAQAEEKRISDTKVRNTQELTAANAAIDVAKKAQDQATADLTAAKASLTKPGAGTVTVRFSRDAQLLATTSSDGTCSVWAISSSALVSQSISQGFAPTNITAQADGTFIASASNGASMKLNQPDSWKLERVLDKGKDGAFFADRVNAVRFSPDGKMLATGSGEPSRSGDINIFDVASGNVLHTWKEHHDDTVLCLDFSPDGKLLASGAADKIARVTEISSRKRVNLFEGHTHHVMGIAFRADGRVLASAGADGIVTTWDMAMGERIKKIQGWTKEVTSLQFIGATSKIVTSSGDNLVRIVNDSGSEVRAMSRLPDFMQSAASTPDGTLIVAGGEDSVLRIWDGASGKELAVFGGNPASTP